MHVALVAVGEHKGMIWIATIVHCASSFLQELYFNENREIYIFIIAGGVVKFVDCNSTKKQI
jgi:hypothetical protein